MRKLLITVCCLGLLFSVGCSKEVLSSSEPISSFENSDVISKEESAPSTDVSNTSSNQEISSNNNESSKPEAPVIPPKTDTFQSNNNSTDKNNNSTEATDIRFSELSFNYSGYISNNESKPYLKGNAIYDILYSGSRTQVGDTVTYNIDAKPKNTTDTVLVSVSANLSYSLSNNKLSVFVNSKGNYDNGVVTVSSKLNPNLQNTYRFAIDEPGNPYTDFSSILGDYIEANGMKYTLVEKGYTTDNPNLSITHYSGAPAWDDQILKANSDWMLNSLSLIDEYKKLSFKKVNFIVTETEIGFSASK